jgi:transcriptional regulator with XRE-family HTH domain
MNHDVYFTGAGEVIRRYRTVRKLRIEDVARKMGVNKSTLCRYEMNESPLSGKLIKDIAKALNVAANKLMFDCMCHLKGEMKHNPFGRLLGKLVAETTGDDGAAE